MKRLHFVILTIIATALLFSISSVIYSKDRYRVQNVAGKVLKRNSTEGQLTGSWSKVKRNQTLSENTVLDIKPGGEIRICDTRTSRIYKSQGDGRTNLNGLILKAERRASRITNGVLRQMNGQERKPKARYKRAGGVIADLMSMSEEEIRKLDSIEATLFDHRVFHKALQDSISQRIHSGNSFTSDLKGLLCNDSTGNVYMNIRNETSSGLFVNIFFKLPVCGKEAWSPLFDDSFYLPENCETDLTEYLLDPANESTFLLIGTEDSHDRLHLGTLIFTLPDSLTTERVVSIVIPTIDIPDSNRKH